MALVIADAVKVGGASAGSLLAAAVKSGLGFDEITDWSLELMADCREEGTRGRLGEVLQRALWRGLPGNAHLLIRDKAYVC